MQLTTPILLGTLAIGLSTSACKSLNTDLGRNVYERELEDSFDDEPAGVVGTTADTRLVIFRENSFVAEPRPEGEVLNADGSSSVAPESSQGLRLFREAAFRLAEARANTVEGMLALHEAGMDDRMIAQLFPSREDWSNMYVATLEISREAILAEFEAGTRSDGLDMKREFARLEAEVDLRNMELEAEAGGWDEGECPQSSDEPECEAESDEAECSEAKQCPVESEKCEAAEEPFTYELGNEAASQEFATAGGLVSYSPSTLFELAPANFEGTSMTPRAKQAWKIKYSSPELAGQTVHLTVTCLDSPKSKHTAPTLSATFTVELNKKGKASFKADLPKRWRLVRLAGPGARPLFAVRL